MKQKGAKYKRLERLDVILSICIPIFVALCILLYGFFYKGWFSQKDHIVDDTQPTESEEQSKLDNEICIPGYGKMWFAANRKQQNITLNNPAENNCYFILSIILDDGTEIWKSEPLEPGKAFDRICLKNSLAAGIYENAVLHYDCYSLADQTPLNDAEIKFVLIVK